MSYNFAALRGGNTIQGCINRLSGGWNVPVGTYSNDPNNLDSVQNVSPYMVSQMMPVRNYILSKYDVPNDSLDLLDTVISYAFYYDSALMKGWSDVARGIRKRIRDAGPEFVKLFNYVRRVAHRGDTKPEDVDVAERARRTAALRRVNRAQLSGIDWYGSNPYIEDGGKTQGNYRYLYIPKRKGTAVESWARAFGARRIPPAGFLASRVRGPRRKRQRMMDAGEEDVKIKLEKMD